VIVAGQRLPILVATRPVDFRCGHQALALIVQNVLKLDPYSGVTVIFRSKRGDRLKALAWDGTGLVLVYKVLEVSGYAWPAIQDGVMARQVQPPAAAMGSCRSDPMSVGILYLPPNKSKASQVAVKQAMTREEKRTYNTKYVRERRAKKIVAEAAAMSQNAAAGSLNPRRRYCKSALGGICPKPICCRIPEMRLANPAFNKGNR
jgi:transposase